MVELYLHSPICLHDLLIHGAEPFLRDCQLCSYSRTSQDFTEPEGSLPPSQEPSTGPYPEPDRSNPHHPMIRCHQQYIFSTGFDHGVIIQLLSFWALPILFLFKTQRPGDWTLSELSGRMSYQRHVG
jgi:hypothetical protein